MMKLNPSLKGSLILAFAAVVLVLVVGYSLLSARYFLNGMDTIVADNLVRVANLAARNPEFSETAMFGDYAVTRRWQDQPDFIHTVVAAPPAADNTLRKGRVDTPGRAPDKMFFYMGVDAPGAPLYVSFYTSPEKVSEMVRGNARGSLLTLLAIGLGTALAVGLVAWWLLRQMSHPVARLGAWARRLDENTLAEPVPDFGFRDLNDFAELMRNSLVSVRQGLKREQAFLRHASHELRTPISVMRNNVELWRKLKSRQPEDRQDPDEAAVMERIDRASQTMKHLTETLLWLGRDDGENLPRTTVRLDRLLEQLAAELSYLLQGKAVRLSVHTEPWSGELPEAAARIVLGNLIRNAFQHTAEGEVALFQRQHEVQISNRQAQPPESSGDLGFGLGLQLTERLTGRLGWRYQNRSWADGRDALLSFDP